MGSSHHYACIAVVITRCERKRRHRHQRVIDTDFDPICRQHACRCLCKHITFQTAVITDGHRLCAALGFYPVREPLGRLAHHIDIHAVRPSAEHAAQSCCSELQRDREAFFDLFLFPFDLCQFRFQIRVFQICRHPALILFLIHFYHSYYLFIDFFVQNHKQIQF